MTLHALAVWALVYYLVGLTLLLWEDWQEFFRTVFSLMCSFAFVTLWPIVFLLALDWRKLSGKRQPR